ncbi:hypothetical protein BCU48_024420 [Vibrio splendidus]|uniref:hypothetical protein n=1 Tax=Vibrio splendidus TaxID=29497 RepID=UPI0039A69223
MKVPEFTQQDVAKLHFSHRVLYQGVSNVKEKLIHSNGPHWHVTTVRLSDVVGSLDPRYAGKSWLALFPCIDALGGLKRVVINTLESFNNPPCITFLSMRSEQPFFVILMANFILMMATTEPSLAACS